MPSNNLVQAPPPGEMWFTAPSGVLTPVAFVPRTAWPTAPAVTADTPGDFAATYGACSGYYSRIGTQIKADFLVNFTVTANSTAAGAARITGVPFAASMLTNAIGLLGSGLTPFAWNSATDTMLLCMIASSMNYIKLMGMKSGIVTAFVPITTFVAGSTYSIPGSIIYDTASLQ